MNAAELFVRALENEGVRYVFGIPGEETLLLVEALRRSSIKLIVTRHEQGAGFMAATYGRLTGRTGVCLATLGPGATNLVTPAAFAQLGGMPMLMITGQKPIKASKQGRFQIVDVVGMMRPLTKFTTQIVDGRNVPSRVREAFRVAEEERPGAVHLEIPEDIAAEEVREELYTPSHARRPIAEEKSVRRAVEMIEEARRPLVLIGAGANRKLTSKMLNLFVAQFGIPFIDTQMGKGVVDGRSPLYLGNAALSKNDFLHCAIQAADLIINVGHDLVEKPPFIMEHGGRPVIHVNFSSAPVDPVYFPQVEVIGDIANSIWQISERLKPQAHWDFGVFQKIRAQWEAHLRTGCDDDRFPIIPQRLVADVRRAVPPDGVIALDNGIYKIWFARNYLAYKPNSVLLDNALATMGAGLSSAMTAKLVHPERKVVAVCGDGGFLMNSQELETAMRMGLDLVVLVLRDNGYGMVRWKQEAKGLADYGLSFGNPDFVRYVESYGGRGHRLQRTRDFLPLLEGCLKEGGLHLIDVPVDYSENQRVLTCQLREGICNIVP